MGRCMGSCASIHLPPLWIISQASGVEPETSVGQWGQELGRRSRCGLKENEDKLDPSGPLYLSLPASNHNELQSNGCCFTSTFQIYLKFFFWPTLIWNPPGKEIWGNVI